MPTHEPAALAAPSFLIVIRMIVALSGVTIFVLAGLGAGASRVDLAFAALMLIGALAGPRRAR